MSAVPQFLWLDADNVVDQGLAALRRNAVVCVPGARYRVIVAVSRLLPLAGLRLMARRAPR